MFHTLGVERSALRVEEGTLLLRVLDDGVDATPLLETALDTSESDRDPVSVADFVLPERRAGFSSLKMGMPPRRGIKLRERGSSRCAGLGGVITCVLESKVSLDAGGVVGSSLSSIGKVVGAGGRSSAGVVSRLGGGELRPDLARGESPLRRFVARWSSSDTLELQLALEVDRTRRPACVSARRGVLAGGGAWPRTGWGEETGVRPEPRLIPRTEPSPRSEDGDGGIDWVVVRFGVELRERMGGRFFSGSGVTSTSVRPLRGWQGASPPLPEGVGAGTRLAGVKGREGVSTCGREETGTSSTSFSMGGEGKESEKLGGR